MKVEIRLSSAAEKQFNSLQHTVSAGLMQKFQLLFENPQYGNPIAKRLIPKQYRRVEVRSLYRVELPLFWRMTYTLVHEGEVLVVLVLDIVDHKQYNKLFRYKR